MNNKYVLNGEPFVLWGLGLGLGLGLERVQSQIPQMSWLHWPVCAGHGFHCTASTARFGCWWRDAVLMRVDGGAAMAAKPVGCQDGWRRDCLKRACWGEPNLPVPQTSPAQDQIKRPEPSAIPDSGHLALNLAALLKRTVQNSGFSGARVPYLVLEQRPYMRWRRRDCCQPSIPTMAARMSKPYSDSVGTGVTPLLVGAVTVTVTVVTWHTAGLAESHRV